MHRGRSVDMHGACGSLGHDLPRSGKKDDVEDSTVVDEQGGGELAHAELMKHRPESARTGPG
jgi:hypothetical protein